MVSDVLKFDKNRQIELTGMDFGSGIENQLDEILGDDKVIVCVSREESLAAMKGNPALFTDRKVRNSSIQLSRYFTDEEKKPAAFLDGRDYKSEGAFINSVNKFFIHTLKWKNRHIFFVIVTNELFEGLKNSLSAKARVRSSGKYKNPVLKLANDVKVSVNLEEKYLGNSESCVLVRQMIATASQHDFSVLILGETGTGKELVARNIHECSSRRNSPFVAINCSAISSELFESELFGHVKGAYTNARAEKEGLWEFAGDGTLFLDEIGDLAHDHQAKILRALQENRIKKVGGTKEIVVKARIIAATNKNIGYQSAPGLKSFREDLYYRISQFIIFTPALRDHAEDIPLMASKIWYKLENSKPLSESVLKRLSYMNWPGNVRSLKHFLVQMNALFGKDTITEEHVHVLHQQEVDSFLAFNTNYKNRKKNKSLVEFEKAVHKMEFLLKAALYCESEEQKKKLLDEVKESLEELS